MAVINASAKFPNSQTSLTPCIVLTAESRTRLGLKLKTDFVIILSRPNCKSDKEDRIEQVFSIPSITHDSILCW